MMATLPENYQRLCTRVDALNPEAATFLRDEAPKLQSFAYNDPNDADPEADLPAAFTWDETPQGWEFWRNIQEQLEAPK